MSEPTLLELLEEFAGMFDLLPRGAQARAAATRLRAEMERAHEIPCLQALARINAGRCLHPSTGIES